MKSFICCSILLFIFFCSCSHSHQSITFHDRVVLGMNGSSTYLDYLKIENYKDGSFTAEQLFKVANNYVDTIGTDKIVSDVIFLGQRAFHTLPEHVFDASSKSMGKLSILGFSFTKGPIDSSSKDVRHYMKLRDVILFKDGEHHIYYISDTDDKKVIDSLLASTEPYGYY